MTKVLRGLVATFLGFISIASLANSLGVCQPNLPGGFTFGIDALYWRPSPSHYDYALRYSDIFFLENADHIKVDNDYDWGFKVNVGYFLPCSSYDIKASLTYYNHDFTDHVTTPDGGLLLPTLTDAWPATIIVPPIPVTATPATGFIILSANPTTVVALASFDPFLASAKSSAEQNAIDLEFGSTVNIGNSMQLRSFFGLRYAKVENTLDVIYQRDFLETPVVFSGVAPFVVAPIAGAPGVELVPVDVTASVTGQIHEIVNQKSNWEGFGPRLGVDGRYALGAGFGIVGSLSTSLLVGEIDSAAFELFQSSLLEVITGITAILPPEIAAVDFGAAPGTVTGFAASQNLSFQHPDRTRIVPNIDAKLGLTYTCHFCNCTCTAMTFEAGYLINHYFNVIDRLSEVGALSPEFRTRQTIDASFDGFFLGVQVKV